MVSFPGDNPGDDNWQALTQGGNQIKDATNVYTWNLAQAGNGNARGLLMIRGWGGGFVVVRGRESRSHGEGTQRVRNGGTGMSGGRW